MFNPKKEPPVITEAENKAPGNLSEAIDNIQIDTTLVLTNAAASEALALVSNAAIQNGQLFIACKPWADIYIEGEKIDTTPLLSPIELEPGQYNIELKNPNFQIHQAQISIRSAQLDSIIVNLIPLNGYLDLVVIPWAKVHINGNYHETTPLKRPVPLPTGLYELKLTNPSFQTWIDSVEVIAGKTVSLEISLKK